MNFSNLVGRCFAPSPTGTEWGTSWEMLRSESDWDGMGDPGPSMPPSGSTNSEELFKAFLADCEDASASREQTAPPEAVVSQERHPNPAPMPGVAAEAEQNPPSFDWEGRPLSL